MTMPIPVISATRKSEIKLTASIGSLRAGGRPDVPRSFGNMAEDELAAPELPFPIFRISKKIHRYILYDIRVVSWLRKEFLIGGVLTGTLHQVPQQNVFLGLPLRLMPEEARLLVERNWGYIVDDAENHKGPASQIKREDLSRYFEEMRLQGQEAAQKKVEQAIRARTRKIAASQNDGHEEYAPGERDSEPPAAESSTQKSEPTESLRPQPPPQLTRESWAVTLPTVSALIPKPRDSEMSLPQVDESSYALFRYMNLQGYFLSPGLRFGCQFMAYPGDPLRYHSHFVCIASDWHEEIDLLDIMAGGRLGTGVKKAFLWGGPTSLPITSSTPVRTFCIEWAGM